jgi:hypothetical protein
LACAGDPEVTCSKGGGSAVVDQQAPSPVPTGGQSSPQAQPPTGAPVEPSVPQKIDLTGTPLVRLEDGVQTSGKTISGLQKAGVQLANNIIAVICTALVGITALVALSELWPSSDVSGLNKLVIDVHARAATLPASSPEMADIRKDIQELSRQIADAKQAQRTFWMQFSQMILLNLLLPVLTAILGYVFGASNATPSDSK